MTRTVLDARGLSCPLPVLRANKAMRMLAVGDELEVLATDPAAPKDFEAFSATAGHALVESDVRDGMFVMVLRKGGVRSE